MPALIEYLLKLSLSLCVVYLFYQLLLRRLTFYTWNRWYLLGYSTLAFVIPFINITPVLERNSLTSNRVISLIPSLQTYTVNVEQLSACPEPIGFVNWNKWDWILLVMGTGIVFFFLRLLVNYLSLLIIKRRAKLITDGTMKIYQVDKNIIPFSFGNSIFINRHLHSGEELQEIIRHEFVHVRQRHSIDILWGELLCMLNWYNPIAWMIRKSIRQNLEFIADDNVIHSGINKKQYQYLLLKVVGNNHFSIANQFNFSSLKTRIAMMNKIRSARIHLFKFSFLLPLLTILLLAFRNGVSDKLVAPGTSQAKMQMAGLVLDANTNQPIPFARLTCKEKAVDVVADENGYYQLEMQSNGQPLRFEMQISSQGYETTKSTENWGISSGTTIEFFGLVKSGRQGEAFAEISQEIPGLAYPQVLEAFNKWKLLQQQYKAEREQQYGQDTVPGKHTIISLHKDDKMDAAHTEFFKKYPKVKLLNWKIGGTEIEIYSEGNIVEKFVLTNTADAAKAKAKYGSLPLPMAGSTSPASASTPATAPSVSKYFLERNPSVANYRFSYVDLAKQPTDILLSLHSGAEEVYNLNDNADMKHFTQKYSFMPPIPHTAYSGAIAAANSKGFAMSIFDYRNNCMVLVTNKQNHEVARILLTDWQKDADYYENKYGKLGGNEKETGSFQSGTIEAANQLSKAPAFSKMTFTADTIYYNSANSSLLLKGSVESEAKVDDYSSGISLSASSIMLENRKPLIYLDGEQVRLDQDYVGRKGGKYEVTTLSSEDALKKYGEKGQQGAVEIKTIPAR